MRMLLKIGTKMILAGCLLTCAVALPTWSDTLILRDGTTLAGTLIQATTNTITFRTPDGQQRRYLVRDVDTVQFGDVQNVSTQNPPRDDRGNNPSYDNGPNNGNNQDYSNGQISGAPPNFGNQPNSGNPDNQNNPNYQTNQNMGLRRSENGTGCDSVGHPNRSKNQPAHRFTRCGRRANFLWPARRGCSRRQRLARNSAGIGCDVGDPTS